MKLKNIDSKTAFTGYSAWTAWTLCSLLALTCVAQDATPTPASSPTPTVEGGVTLIPPAPTPDPELAQPTVSPSPSPAEAGRTPDAFDDLNASPNLASGDLENPYVPPPPSKFDANSVQPPSPANGIDLDDAVAMALKKNTDILRQLAEIKRNRGLVIEVRAAALPTLTANSTYNKTDDNLSGRGTSTTSSSSASTGFVTIPGSTSSSGVVTPPQDVPISLSSDSNSFRNSSSNNESWQLTFEVQQTLYAGGRIVAGIKSAQLAQDAAFYQLRDTVDQVIKNVRTGFYTVLLDRALIKVSEQSIELLQRGLTDQQNRFEAGTVPRFNVLRAEVELANARPNLIRARNNYVNAQRQLAKLIGVPWSSSNEPFPIKGLLVYQPVTMDVDNAVQRAKENRASLKVQRQNILVEVQQIKVELAGYQPTITANAGYEFRNDQSADDLESEVDGWFFGFTGSWNLFDGFATDGKVKQARARLENAQVNYDDAVAQVELEVETAYTNLVQAREVIESQEKTVQQAVESLRLATERLSAGAGTQLEVLDARVALTDAQTTAIQALADYNSAVAELDRVTAVNTRYDDTFDDPLTNKKTRKYWFSKKKPAGAVETKAAAPDDGKTMVKTTSAKTVAAKPAPAKATPTPASVRKDD